MSANENSLFQSGVVKKCPLDVGSSETRRKTTIQQVSPHRPRTRRGANKKEIGSFLAGLIDSDGHWSAIPQLVISFEQRESSLAHYVKKTIGYGQVHPVQGKAALRYVCAHRDGMRKIALLCAPYLRHPDKWFHYSSRCAPVLGVAQSPPCSGPLLDDWWLAGFFVGDGSISCRIVDRPGRSMESRFLLRIDQKGALLLKKIQEELGGSIGYRHKQDTYYYSSVSYKNAVRWINYLDRAFLMGVKLTTYAIWRKAFLLVQQGRHRTPLGEEKLRRMALKIAVRNGGKTG